MTKDGGIDRMLDIGDSRSQECQKEHYVENTGDTDLVFLETFASDEFQSVSLNR